MVEASLVIPGVVGVAGCGSAIALASFVRRSADDAWFLICLAFGAVFTLGIGAVDLAGDSFSFSLRTAQTTIFRALAACGRHGLGLGMGVFRDCPCVTPGSRVVRDFTAGSAHCVFFADDGFNSSDAHSHRYRLGEA